MNERNRLLTVAVAALLGACGGGGSGGGGTPAKDAAPPAPDAAMVEADAAPATPDAGTQEQALVRTAGRMTIEQLARSIPVVTGGLRWTEDFGQGPVDMLDVLAPTLGAPDYRLVTQENLEPGLIMAKFLQDASHRICTRWVVQDRAAAPAERTLVHHANWDSLDEADVNTTLRALELRFFARHVADDDTASIADLRDLFFNAAHTAAPGDEARDGWMAVCIALMTDPEFILY
jgi:hypothetical protein